MRIARAGAHFGYSGWKLRNRMNAFTDSGILFAPDRVEESRASGRPAFARILQLERLILYLLALPKSLYFNLRMFGRRGLRLPVLVSHRVALYSMEGRVELPENAPFGMVKIGFGAVGLFDRARSRSILDNRGAMIFRGPAFIGHGTKMATGPAGEIEFGSHFQISAEAQLYAAKRITFGRNCGVSWDVLILDDDFHPVYNRAGKRLIYRRK